MEVEVAHNPQIKAEPMDGDSDSEDEMDTITTTSSRRAVAMQAVPAPVRPSAEDIRFLMNVVRIWIKLFFWGLSDVPVRAPPHY